MKNIIITSVIALLLSACATGSKDIASSYVSPLQYSSYDCDQLKSEAHRINVRANELAGTLDAAEQSDQGTAVVTALLFWPAAFALGGNKQQEAEYARLQGERDAIQQASIMKKCKGS